MLLITPELLEHLTIATFLRCQQLRRDGYAVPADLARLRDELHAAASSGLDLPPVERILAVSEPIAVDVSEAARRLSLSVRSVRRMTADGRLPVLRVGRRVLVPVAALDRLTEEAA